VNRTEKLNLNRGPKSFSYRMNGFIDSHIDTLESESTALGGDKVKRNVRIAVIDSGIHIEDEDHFLNNSDVQDRIKARKNFFAPKGALAPDPEDWEDVHGHGTHVARILFEFAPRADILIAKVTHSKSLRATHQDQLLKVNNLHCHSLPRLTDRGRHYNGPERKRPTSSTCRSAWVPPQGLVHRWWPS